VDDLEHADRMAGTDGREHLAFGGKSRPSGPMPTSRYCDHRPLSCSSFFSSAAWWRAGLQALDFSAQCTFDLGAPACAARSGAPRACSSTHPLEQ